MPLTDARAAAPQHPTARLPRDPDPPLLDRTPPMSHSSTRLRRVRLALPSLLLLAVHACASAPASNAAGRTPRGAAALKDAADEVLARTIAARRAAGKSGLSRSINLMSAAQLQAEQMAKTGTMSHALPGTAYPTLKARLAAVSYEMRAAGENIAEGQRNPAEVLSSWMHSAGHRDNILSSEFTEMGTGVAVGRNGRLYWTQVFGRPRSSARRVAD
jgi:uncharacterized protein YkwD